MVSSRVFFAMIYNSRQVCIGCVVGLVWLDCGPTIRTFISYIFYYFDLHLKVDLYCVCVLVWIFLSMADLHRPQQVFKAFLPPGTGCLENCCNFAYFFEEFCKNLTLFCGTIFLGPPGFSRSQRTLIDLVDAGSPRRP